MSIDSINNIDLQLLHFFNGSDSLFLDQLSVTLTSGFTWIPLYFALLYLIIKNNETMGQIVLTIFCAALCILLADGVSEGIAKPLVMRYRPSHDPFIKYSIDVVTGVRGDGEFGFFSAHAANTFSLAVFFCLIIKNKILSVTLVFWSLINCWTRLYLGVHYPSDIIVGLLWGAIVGVSVFYLYRHLYFRISSKNNYISSQYTITGYNIIDVDIVMSVFIAIFVYSLIRAVLVFV